MIMAPHPTCVFCDEPVFAHEQDPCFRQPCHTECSCRSIIGSVAHQEHRCACYGGSGEDDPALTKREAAKAAYKCWREANEVKA